MGLEKLADATVQVEKLQDDIVKLQPVLVKTSAEVDEMMITITADRQQADKTKAIVEIQEAEANSKAAEAKGIADDAQKDLDEALPALEAATKSLKSLNKSDIVEVKAMKNPPAGVKLTLECVCILQKVKPIRKEAVPNQLTPYTEVSFFFFPCCPRHFSCLLQYRQNINWYVMWMKVVWVILLL